MNGQLSKRAAPPERSGRPLGAMETFFATLNQHWSANMVRVMELRGTVDPQRLSRALRTVASSHPVLESRLAPDQGGFRFFRSNQLLTLEVVDGDARSADRILEEELLDRLPATGPLARLRWLPRNDGSSGYLVFTLHHAIADGVSATHLTQSLFDSYDRDDDVSEQCAAIGPSSPCIEQLYTQRDPNVAHDVPPPQLPDFRCELTSVSAPETLYARSTALTTDETARLSRLCKSRGVTINSAVCAGALLSKLHVWGEAEKRNALLSIPVSLRTYLGIPSEQVLCAVRMSHHLYALSCSTDMWSLAASIQTSVRNYRATTISRLPRAASAHPSLTFATSYAYAVGVTNLGTVELQCGSFSIVALYGSVATPYPFFVHLRTLHNALSMSVTTSPPLGGPEQTARFVETLAAKLRKFT